MSQTSSLADSVFVLQQCPRQHPGVDDPTGVGGQPTLASQSVASRGTERHEAQNFQTTVSRLRQRLEGGAETRPEAWITLAQTFQALGQPDQAAGALGSLFAQGVLGLYAEALIQSDDWVVSPKAEAVLDRLLAIDPTSVAGIYYKSMALEQPGVRDTEGPDRAGDLVPAMDGNLGSSRQQAGRVAGPRSGASTPTSRQRSHGRGFGRGR